MGLPSFECTVPGKIVLAGEHAVMRGSHALTIPHPQFKLRLRAHVDPRRGPMGATPELAAWMEKTRSDYFSAISKPIPHWALDLKIEIDSTIPQGAGAGSSAALCVAMLKLWNRYDQLPLDRHHALATSWENAFHGTSSGMDVAAVLWGRPLLFKKGASPQGVDLAALPELTVHDTGLRSSTRDGIATVQRWRDAHPSECDAADAIMDRAALEAYDALKQTDLPKLARAMQRAQALYERWGLMPQEAKALQLDLEQQGALAVKMTGSGLGGFLVALWDPRTRPQTP